MKRAILKVTNLVWIVTLAFAVAIASCTPDTNPVDPTPTPGPDPTPGVEVVIPDISQIDASKYWPLLSTIPSFVSPDATNDAVIVVNVAGSTIDEGEDLYAHTGLITDKSVGGNDWKYVKHEWTENELDCKLTHVGGTIYAMTIAGGPRAFYNVTDPAEQLLQLAFVFRNSDGSKEVKLNGQDIYADLVPANSLAVKFLSPVHGTIYPIGAEVVVSAVAQNAQNLTLSLNGTQLCSEQGNAFAYTHQVSSGGDMEFKAVATAADGSTMEAVSLVAALKDTETKSRPADAKDGVTVNGNEATVVLYAPGKRQVVLLGDFNRFAPSNDYVMYKDGDYFWTTISGLTPNTEYAYQFLVDGTIKLGDPYATKILDPWNDKWINENGVIYPNLKEYPTTATEIVSVFSTSTNTYNWQVTNFKRPDKNSLAVYELLFRDFTPEGSVKAATAKLDYLEALGINAIELMPIQEFDGNNSWGYNPCFYFAPDKAYGTENDYKEFIDECHKRGIAVILDVVFNHATGQFPWLRMWDNGGYPAADNPFFNVTAKHPFNVYNDLNHDYPKTREYFSDVLQYWLTEYKIDGYRFDLAKGITQTNSGENDGACQRYDSNRISHLKYYYDAMQEASEGSYMILEYFVCDQEESEMANYGALPWRNAIEGYNQSIMGWTDPSSNLSRAYAKDRVSYMESHDEARVAWKALQWGNTGVKEWENLSNRIQAAMALHFLTPYPKMMWQGGELGDARELAEGDARTEKKPMEWSKLSDPNIKALYEACCKIISFRTDHPELYGNNASQSCATYNVGDDSMGGKHLVYTQGNTTVLVAANFLVGTSNPDAAGSGVTPGSTASFLTTSPATILNSTTEDVVVTIDASNSPLAGESEVYAHTGVLTTASSGDSDWKHVKADWNTNIADCKLTNIGNNKWTLTIKGGPKAFYGVGASEHINKLAFVFRSANGTKELKNNGKDIFVVLGDAKADNGGTTSTAKQLIEFDITAPNGTYKNLITGESVTVSNGKYHNSLYSHEYVVLVKE